MAPPLDRPIGSPPQEARRNIAVDVMRGLVILILVPDLYGGFSFYKMARQFPDSDVWAALGAAFSHVEWTGVAVWDLVMPAFVLLVGVSLALSVDRRRLAGQTSASLLRHVLLRSASLVVLGLLMSLKPRNLLEDLLPYIVLATGLPWQRWCAPAARWPLLRAVGAVLPWLVVLGIGTWMWRNPQRLSGYDFNQILTQLGLAYLPAFVLMGARLRTPAFGAALVLLGWTLAFLAYPAPAGIAPDDGLRANLFAHWNNGSNVAAAFDRWLFGFLPRDQPFVVHPHGYHTLEFVPLVAVMLVGVVVGRRLSQQNVDSSALARRLLVQALLGCVAGLILAQCLSPLVKSLWTPSWTVFSTSVSVLILSLLLLVFADHTRDRWAFPIAVLGTNSILLYVMSGWDRWRILLYADRLFGTWLSHVAARPLIEWWLVLATLWLIAWLLARARITIKL